MTQIVQCEYLTRYFEVAHSAIKQILGLSVTSWARCPLKCQLNHTINLCKKPWIVELCSDIMFVSMLFNNFKAPDPIQSHKSLVFLPWQLIHYVYQQCNGFNLLIGTQLHYLHYPYKFLRPVSQNRNHFPNWICVVFALVENWLCAFKAGEREKVHNLFT